MGFVANKTTLLQLTREVIIKCKKKNKKKTTQPTYFSGETECTKITSTAAGYWPATLSKVNYSTHIFEKVC